MKKNKIITSMSIMLFLMLFTAVLFSTAPLAQATAPEEIIVYGPNGAEHSLSNINDTSTFIPTINWGGYVLDSELYAGEYQGVSLYQLCIVAGYTLEPYQNVTVQTEGDDGANMTFSYAQVAYGFNISPQYTVYDNSTGEETTPLLPLTIMVAYQFANGTALPNGEASRLLVVGSQGLLFKGQNLSAVKSLSITNVGEAPTPTPTATPTQTPTPPPATATPPVTATPTATSPPETTGIPSSYIVVAIGVIAAIAVTILILIREKKPNSPLPPEEPV
ncbi:MAG: hypothetical protein NWF01_06150 [Candidatus Bathyarchaeota archaeon]|nr:hypothetical protein [Candidatus Bathyarchaeota archaeon]